MNLQEVPTETAALAVLAACNQEVRKVGETPVLLAPQGFQSINLEKLLPAPTRKRGTVVLNDAESFIAVVNDQKTEATRMFSTVNPPTFTAVFNGVAAEAGWGDHLAKYNAPLSPEWKIWTAIDGKAMGQVEVAQFLEANLVDVLHVPENDPDKGLMQSPDGSTLLEVCRTLEATKKVDFKSSVRLGDGSTQFTYNEDVQGSAKAGTLSVPEHFTIAVPVFENGDKWPLLVRFRYRIDSGVLKIWFELVRPHKIIEVAVKELREQIAKETALQVLNGALASASSY
ncbi:DUF2303 family protein [Comamonas jiangduensis]|uniref:DUF2303 family protein n=1 Tax=Comamonas jiangduensis TaxID=1194168 RepID=UPI003BF863CC